MLARTDRSHDGYDLIFVLLGILPLVSLGSLLLFDQVVAWRRSSS